MGGVGGGWAVQEWVDWLNATPLEGWIMDEAIQAWKQDFEASDFMSQEAFTSLRAENTRASKNNANDMLNGAWKVHLAKTHGRQQQSTAAAITSCGSSIVRI